MTYKVYHGVPIPYDFEAARLRFVGRHITTRDVLHAASDVLDIPIEEIRGARHFRNLVTVRAAVSVIGRELLQLSNPQIAKTMNRDHTTVLHNWRVGRCRPNVMELVGRIIDQLEQPTRIEQALKAESERARHVEREPTPVICFTHPGDTPHVREPYETVFC